MRQIKFRARNANLPRCWVYGYFVVENHKCFIVNEDGRFPVIAGTEGQFVGLPDKNGKEIYEGDVVKGNMGNYEIRWDSIRTGYFGHCLGADGESYFIQMKTLCHHKIIGNIYENPELLEERFGGKP